MGPDEGQTPGHTDPGHAGSILLLGTARGPNLMQAPLNRGLRAWKGQVSLLMKQGLRERSCSTISAGALLTLFISDKRLLG